MNEDKHDIDKLLHANMAGQLAGLDWDRFDDEVCNRLATIELRHRPRPRYLAPLAVAAGLVLVAGALIAMFVKPHEQAISSSGRADVSFPGPAARSRAVTVLLEGQPVTRCEVTLLDSTAPQTDERTSPSWCMVVERAAPSRESDRRRNDADLARLF